MTLLHVHVHIVHDITLCTCIVHDITVCTCIVHDITVCTCIVHDITACTCIVHDITVCTGWPKSLWPLFGRPLLEKFILEYNYVSMVTDVIKPEKYDYAVKNFLILIFLFKIEKIRFFHVFSLLPRISEFQGLFYGFTSFLVCLTLLNRLLLHCAYA